MAVITERMRQTTTGAWVASSAGIPILLDRIGLVTRYEVVHQLTPSATLVGANQPDGLWRPFQNVQIGAGGVTYFALPSEAGGQGGVLLHYLNMLDRLGIGHTTGGITAPDLTYVPVRIVFHAGVRPQRKDNLDNPYDLTGFVPVSVDASPQLTWVTNGNAVVDDTVTITSGVMVVTANRVMGSTADIQAEMADQGVTELLAMAGGGATGFVPNWIGEIQSPTAAAADYSAALEAQLGGFLKRQTFLAQDGTGTRPARAQDELTQIKLEIRERSRTYLQVDTEQLTLSLPFLGTMLTADDAVTTYISAAPKGIYPIDLRPHGETDLQRIMGLDLRGRQTGYARWMQTFSAVIASGDDILSLAEKMNVYTGRLSNT